MTSNNTPSNKTQLNLHSTLDLIEVVPMFAGYRPTDSLVALYVNASGFLDLAARFDLSLDPADLAGIVDKLTQLCRAPGGTQAQSVHLVAYSDDTHTADQTLLFVADNWGRDRTPNDPATILATLASASTDSWAEINPNQPDRTDHPDPVPGRDQRTRRRCRPGRNLPGLRNPRRAGRHHHRTAPRRRRRVRRPDRTGRDQRRTGSPAPTRWRNG